MASPFPYSAIIAKCRAMSAKLLRYDDYAALCSSSGLSEAAAYLSQHGLYSDELSGVSLSYINRSSLEELFAHGFDRICGELLTFAGGDLKRVIGVITKKREVARLIDRAFICASGNTAEGVKAESTEDFLNSIRGTVYSDIAVRCVRDGKLDCNRLESALYSHYFESLSEAASGAGDEDVADMIDTLIDYRSIDVILRARKNFGMSAEAIYPFLPPNTADCKKGGKRFTRAELMSFCSLGEEELRKKLEKRFGSDFSEKNYLDANYRNMFLYKYYRKAFASMKPSFGVPFAFIGLCETELTNLVHIIEGLRYKLPPEKILECVSAMQEVRT